MDFDKDFCMMIGGQALAGAAGFDVVNPATGVAFARAPAASPADLDAAVAAARRAFAGWAATPIDARKALLKALGDAVFAHIEPLAQLLTREQGKPLAEARTEVMGSGYWLQAYTALDLPVTVNEDSAERYSETRHVPLGVVGAIAPWNFPLLLAMFKVAPALLAGNTVVLKPSPCTPLTTLKFAELAAGILPAGVLNVVSGGDELGPWMTAHPGFDKISFTGSTATGRRVMAAAASTLKRVTLELGGNDAAIVMPDVNIEETAAKLFWGAFTNNGQICIATKRAYIHKAIYAPLRDALFAYAKTVKVGDGAQDGTQIGPMNNRAQYERVQALVADAEARGCTLLRCELPAGLQGLFLPITLVDNPPEDSRIVQEEQFGPVLPLIRVDSEDEAIARANGTDYGLGATVWAADEDKAMALAQRLASGTVWVNSSQHLSPLAAFGGMKQSGVGVEGGVEGLLEYTTVQTIVRGRHAVVAA